MHTYTDNQWIVWLRLPQVGILALQLTLEKFRISIEQGRVSEQRCCMVCVHDEQMVGIPTADTTEFLLRAVETIGVEYADIPVDIHVGADWENFGKSMDSRHRNDRLIERQG